MTNEEWRNHDHYKFDPLAEEIKPALLNSADIKRYVDEGCLIERDDFDDKRLKTASYEMRLLGELYHWDSTDNGRLEQHCDEVCEGKRIILPKNSITYLWTKEKLLLPEYIAARFNLHIRYVHKGILLGTGPLVDPGFFGSLLIPLHNLTDNNYELEGGKGIIWVEFTKVSENMFWNQLENKDRPSDLKYFPDVKDLTGADDYLRKSGVISDIPDKSGVQSAFKGLIYRSEKSATDAKKSADDAHKKAEQMNERFKNIGWIAGIVSFLTVTLTMIGIWLAGHNLISDTVSRVQDSRNREFSAKIEMQDDKLKGFEADLEDMKTHLMEMSNSLNELKQQTEVSGNIEKP